MADDLTVRNQDELDRVLNNLDTLDPECTLVFAPRDPKALNRTQFILSRTIPNPIRVDEGAHVNTDAEGLSVTVNGGKFESPFTPQLDVNVEGGNATVPRGSKVRAIDGTVHIHGGKVTNNDTDIELRGKAQANTNSGTVRAFDESYVYADGDADVRGFGKARIDTFSRATFRADDQVTVRAHDASTGHAHGTSLVHCNDARNDITWVSPDAQVNAIDGMSLKVSDDVPASRLSAATLNAPNANWERVSPFEANMADHRDIIKVSAANSAHGDLVRSAEDNPDVKELLDKAPEHLKADIREMFAAERAKEQERAGVTSPTSGDKYLVYIDADGGNHYQPVWDVTEAGTLIDPETGDDMEMIGWSNGIGERPRIDDMDLMYTDSAGNVHRQSWRDLEESGTLIDPETGDDMELDSAASVDDDEFYCCAGCECGNGCAPGCEVGPVCPGHGDTSEDTQECDECGDPFETHDDGTTHHIDRIDGGGAALDRDHVPYTREARNPEPRTCPSCGGEVRGGSGAYADVCNQYPLCGKKTPVTEKAVVIPNHDIRTDDPKTIKLDAVEGVRPEGAVIAMPDDILLKVSHKNGEPNTIQTFDWENKKWNRSMSVAAGPGKALLGELENMSPEARKVPENVASAYGHCTGACLMCGRGLKSTSSLSAGYGPECKGKLR